MTEGPDAAGRFEDGSQQLENGYALQERKADEQAVPTVEPKVFAPYEDRPGELPRRILVERCKRRYASVDLNAQLRELNIVKQLNSCLLDEKAMGGTQTPLELFDNTDFDDRPLHVWAELVRTRRVTARGMRAGAPIKNRWQCCLVTGFDSNTSRFDVQFEESGPVESLARLYICFDAEDPLQYVERLRAAIDRRNMVQASILLSLYADNMPMDNLKPLDSEQVNRVVQNSTRVRSLTDRSTDASSLIQEFSMNHMRALNAMVIRHLIRSRHHDDLLMTIPFRNLPPEDPVFATPKAITTEAETSFSEKKEDFCFFSLLTKAEIVRILIATQKENHQLASQYFFASSSKALRLEEFVHAQHTSITALGSYIKDTWAKAHVTAVQLNLRDIRKGWFNLNEADIEVYRFSKLKRFLTRTSFVMEDYLRDLIVHSLERFVAYIQRYTTARATVLSCSEVHLTPRSGGGDETAAATAAARQQLGGSANGTGPAEYSPMLTIELKLVPSDPNAIAFANSPKEILEAILHLFDEPFTVARSVVTVERQTMTKLFWSHDPVLQIPMPNEARVKQLRDTLEQMLETALAPMDEFLATFAQYRDLALLNVDEYAKSCGVKYCTRDNLQLQQLHALIIEQKRKREELDASIPVRMDLGFIRVSNEAIRKALGDKQDEIVRKLSALMISSIQASVAEITEQFEDIHRRLKVYPANIETLMELKEYMATVPAQIDAMMGQVHQNNKHLELAERLHIRLPYDVLSASWGIVGWPKRLHQTMATQTDDLENARKRYQREMEDDQVAFEDSVRQLQLEIQSLRSCTDIQMHEETATKVKALRIQLGDAEAQVKLFNSREDLFGREHTEYTVLTETQRLFEPYSDAWTSIHNWLTWEQSWMRNPFTTLNAEEVERGVADVIRLAQRAAKFFDKNGAQEYSAMLASIKFKAEEFRPFVPVITALRNPGMRDRHWQQLSDAIGVKVAPNAAFTLETVIAMGLHTYVDPITQISEKAGKEFAIETALIKMEQAWAGLRLRVEPYRSTGTCILKGIDELITLLDEHITMTQAMAFSAFKGPFDERITSWNKTLQTVSEVVDEWVTLQRSWLYLQPIFDSPDINKQLPQEGKRFSTVDKYWRQIMTNAGRGSLAIKFCDDLRLLDRLREGSKLLELVQKGLSDYLETKRAGFSRFYFLSDDELLEILSESKDPLRVQPHLKKCFEGIKTVDFQSDLKITAMNSAEKEKVPFVRPVDPVDKNIEHWMVEVNDQMCASVRHQMILAIEDYLHVPRVDWIQQWPAQVVINGSQIHWTTEVEEALSAKGRDGISEYHDKLVSQLTDMVVLIRNPLPESTRITVGALAVIDVHARDVVKKMIDADVQRTTDFDWISQMRFYWEGNRDNGEVTVVMVSSKQPYGYEYLGNSPRLVITPLTDKCYLTIMGALQMILGGAPAGPAGTGKTETTKDLAKALAKQCVVYNCSDGLDYLGMGKMFKGLASSGAWACFDEFNRINIEVLSVIAQQIMNLQHAVQAGEKRLFFEGTDIAVSPNFAVFITMNPGYAGRTELPDNLEALFRPVAMMVPDYALIAEIMLFSYGYMENRKCAQKMVATFRLCSEQLSSQDHYDYGMRAVKTVITTAGNLKRAHPDENEEALLLRALQDVNVPKFLAHDLPLFEGILSDLFPGVMRPPSNYGPLKVAIYEAIREQNLQPVPVFVRKNIELYEMICVRHGLMVVGPTGGGKSCTISVLEQALCKLKAKAVQGPRYEQVQKFHLNPKSITMGQLYGQFDPNTREWQDGVLCGIVRDCIRQEDSTLKWVVFDGPVDALWIENMNTVLDDNKKLCLTSGEIMVLTNEMTMMFEVEDLAVASPATVSRCGMVYMEPTSLGYDPLAQSWLQHNAKLMNNDLKARLRTLFDQLLSSCLGFLRKYCVEPLETMNNALIESLLNMLDCFLFEPQERHSTDSRLIPRALSAEQLDALFLFSLLWSVGCTSDTTGRHKFEAFLREEVHAHAMNVALPRGRSLYEYKYSTADSAWVHWNNTVPAYSYDPNLPYSELIVPTVDSICYTFLLDTLVVGNKHVLMTGQTGTGKTVNISTHLQQGFSDAYVPITFTFSAQTSANQTQDLIDSKCEKRRKGVYGPQVGKQLLIFIDDINMPQREFYGAQPPIELLRQWFDGGGWYDRKNLTFRNIVDVTFVAACGPPGGGRNPVTARFLRHFNVIAYTPMSEASMHQIFATIFCNALSSFDETLQVLGESFVQASIDVFSTVAKELRPTPAKPHYTFNLRDISKVFQGLLMMSHRRVTTAAQLARMWIHENCRVYADRLVSEEDGQWFQQLLSSKLEERTQITWDEALAGREHIICSDFLIPGADPRVYEEVEELEALQAIVDDYLTEYNSNSKQPMNLVLFRDALQHVARISRVLRQPSGNALLLGIGGSGRQSLTRLAAFIAGYEVFQIEITKGYGLDEWRDNLRDCLMKAGIQDKPIVFLFNDTQIVDESMLEDVNSVLNSGDVPNLYGPEELETIATACKPDCVRKKLPPTKLNIFAQYLNRVKRNIHLVLCMSPLGAPFRTRLRMFPSIVNCCTIDWFAEWPPDALQSVAASFIGQAGLELAEQEALVVQFVQHIHTDVSKASRVYAQQHGRHFYVTPTTYLELLATYKSVLKLKRAEIGTLRTRLETGLLKLISAAEQVQALQEQLTRMEPELVATQAEVEAMIVQIGTDKEAAAVVQRKVAQEEAVAQEKAAQTKEIADDAQRDLDEALPALDEAVACLSELKKSDIDEVRSLGKPPRGVVITIEACCIMFDIPPEKVKDPDNPMKKINDYFKAAQRTILTNANKLLADMKDFDRDNIPPAVIEKIGPYIENEEFQPDVIAKASKACRAMCMWVRAMYKYHQVAIMVEPKKEQLRAAQQSLDETLEKLAEAQARLKENTEKIAALEEAFQEASDRKERLAFEVEECRARLDRAQKLIGGLGGERARWTQEVADLQARYGQLVGDALVCAGSVAYLGAFTPDLRNRLVAEWQNKLKDIQLAHSSDCNLRSVLADAVLIRQWNLCGLPNDVQSVENGMIMHHGRRYPLLIDPQGQANLFIKQMGKDASLCPNGIDVIKLTDKNFLRTLENGVRFGRWVLLENVEETLDAALEPLLLQQRFKQGGTEMIKLGDNTIPWNDSFKFFITTKLSNPHYPPEICVKVSLINFAVTFSGLEDQLLGVVVVEEMPELEQKKNSLMIANAKMKKELKEIEDKILYMLSNSTGNILDDHELIDTLATSKKTSEEIVVKVHEAEATEKHIDESRERYRPVAYRGAILYFCITDLSAVDPMYQYSIQWFKALFVQAIRLAEASDDLDQRLQSLIDFFTYYVYINICRSLFERHKLLFSFLMLIRVLQGSKKINELEWQFLISGKTPDRAATENPAPDWIDKRMWDEIQCLSSLPSFKGLAEHVCNSTQQWRDMYDSLEPHTLPLPGYWNASLTSFQKLCVLRCLRADKCPEAIMNYIMNEAGKRFVEPPPFDLEGCFTDSSPFTPLIFILSKGSDPTKAFQEFSARMKMDRKIAGLSLGQGQGPKAARLIQEACQRGTWVYLQNCHLHVSWLAELERICEQFTPETVHRDFRLWLTSMPCKEFPVTLLQNGIKMTNEPPKGLKANLRNSFFNLDDDALNATTKPSEYRYLLFGLCFFHAIVQERRKFGPLGWNIPYEFNNTDLDISNGQLKSFLDQYEEIPYRVLTFLTSYINYGGRVTDYIDLRTIDVIMRDFYKPETLQPKHPFDANGVYYSFEADPARPQQSYLEYIDSLPLIADPGVFGLHDNANISSALAETYTMFDTLLSLQPKEGGSTGTSREETVATVAKDILAALKKRGQFDIQAISMQYPVLYSESMNTVLIQECIRYNRLIEEMEKSLPELIMALSGLVVMSGALEEMANRIVLQQVPAGWEAKAYPSLKPLGPWVDDLMMRLDFILQWIADGVPAVFWISGLYFPQAFLTGTLQNFARKYRIPIDTVEFNFVVSDQPWEAITEKPDDGVYIRGLYLEGARWDASAHSLNDCFPKKLFEPLPVIHLLPEQNRPEKTGGIYRCPVYKILSRRGTLSTTGHSTNFIMWIELPSNRPDFTNNLGKADQDTWIKAGVAAFCSLRY